MHAYTLCIFTGGACAGPVSRPQPLRQHTTAGVPDHADTAECTNFPGPADPNIANPLLNPASCCRDPPVPSVLAKYS